MKKLSAVIIFCAAYTGSYTATAQSTGIGTITPDTSAVLDITAASKGLLIPRVSLTGAYDAATIPNAAQFMVVFNTNYNMVNNLSGQGIYVNNGAGGMPNWVRVGSGNWSLTGNAGTYAGYNFIGTTDAQPLVFKVNNQNSGIIDSLLQNTALGFRSLEAVTSGAGNISLGYKALKSNTTGYYNNALGSFALYNNTTGNNNVADGFDALHGNTSGSNNTGVGYLSLYGNTAGSDNVAVGFEALSSTMTGSANTACGEAALASNTTGSGNVAAGDNALFNNTSGYSNVAIGIGALYNNIDDVDLVAIGDSALYYYQAGGSSSENTAVGSKALLHNSSGVYNTAVGYRALFNNNGSGNTATGVGALYNNTSGHDNTAYGATSLYANTTGAYNVGIGQFTMFYNTAGSDNIAIGYGAMSALASGAGKNVVIGRDAGLYLQGIGNVALGYDAMFFDHSSSYQTAVGYKALTTFNSSGGFASNTAIGNLALTMTTTGYDNTAVGDKALDSNTQGYGNTAIGHEAGKDIKSTGMHDCTFLGNKASFATLTANYVGSTAIGANSSISASYQIVLGDPNIAQVVPGNNGLTNLGLPGHLWQSLYATNGTIQSSDFRLKKNIYNTPYGLKEILALRPVVYNWKKEGDGNIRMSGFIAQEVEKLVPEAVVAPKNDAEFYGMKYDALIPVLTKAVQEQQVLIEQLQARLSVLEENGKTAIIANCK